MHISLYIYIYIYMYMYILCVYIYIYIYRCIHRLGQKRNYLTSPPRERVLTVGNL